MRINVVVKTDQDFLRLSSSRQKVMRKLRKTSCHRKRKALTELASLLQSIVEDYEKERCKDRIGKWFPTVGGNFFWPEDPRPDDVHIEDVAHALSLQNRFMGHIRGAYSVAQHSVLVSLAVDPKYALEGLLHDAGEAYLGDVAVPIKRLLTTLYAPLENRVIGVVWEKFSLDKSLQCEREVHDADMRLAAAEIRDLTRYGVTSLSPSDRPYPLEICPIKPKKARKLFLARFHELLRRRTCVTSPATNAVTCHATAVAG